jgi:hypothetical protein
MSTDSIFAEDSENTSTQSELSSPLLPRSPWNSQLDYLRLVFRAKKALDRIEKEAGISKTYH